MLNTKMRIALATLATLSAVPALATVPTLGAYNAFYSIEVGGAGSVNGNDIGTHVETLGRSYGDASISVNPAAALSSHGHSEGEFQSVFVDSSLTYDYQVSFSASTSLYSTYGSNSPVSIAGFVQVLATGNAAAYATIGDQYYSCKQDPFNDICGTKSFRFTTPGDSVDFVDLGHGRGRYTVTGSLQLSTHVTAFGDAGVINTGRSFIDPLISLDSDFATLTDAHDATVQLSPGIVNGSSAPPVGGVPEPTSWAMMLAGFGVIGSRFRRQRMAVA